MVIVGIGMEGDQRKWFNFHIIAKDVAGFYETTKINCLPFMLCYKKGEEVVDLSESYFIILSFHLTSYLLYTVDNDNTIQCYEHFATSSIQFRRALHDQIRCSFSLVATKHYI